MVWRKVTARGGGLRRRMRRAPRKAIATSPIAIEMINLRALGRRTANVTANLNGDHPRDVSGIQRRSFRYLERRLGLLRNPNPNAALILRHPHREQWRPLVTAVREECPMHMAATTARLRGERGTGTKSFISLL